MTSDKLPLDHLNTPDSDSKSATSAIYDEIDMRRPGLDSPKTRNSLPPGFATSGNLLVHMMGEGQIQNDNTTPEKGLVNILNQGRENLGPQSDSSFTNQELSKMVTPRNLTSSPFKAFEDLSALTEEPDKVPEGRHKSGCYVNNETYWIEAINNRIAKGDIDKDTLVISDTGHTPAIAYAMAQKFHSDIFMNLPAKQVTGITRKATEDQIQTFAQGIREGVGAGPRIGTSTLLGIDAHQDGPTAQSVLDKLPSAEKLKEMGIKKVFLCLESRDGSSSTHPYSSRGLPGIDSYLAKLKASGFNVVEGNCDMRPPEQFEMPT